MEEDVEANTGGIIAVLAEHGGETIISIEALARSIGKHPDSIRRAIGRNELPQPIRLMGKPVWTVKAISAHLEKRLADAAEEDHNHRKSQIRHEIS